MSHTAVITGVGPGLGAALVRKFVSKGCQVGMFARSADFLDQLAKQFSGAHDGDVLAVPTDVTDPEQVANGFKKVRSVFGPIEILINHAGSATWAGLLDMTIQDFEQAWRVGPYASFLCAREAVQDMLRTGRGTILFTGATSSVRGRGDALAFSSAKFGVRGLAESLARELWPKGIHVAHIIVDGIIHIPDVRKAQASGPQEPLLNSDSMAEAYWALITQEKGAWTLELDLRPFNEDFFV